MFRFWRDLNASIICTVFSIQKQLLCILANRIGMNNKTNCVTSSERKSTSMFMFIETKSTLSASATEKRSVLFSYFIYLYRYICVSVLFSHNFRLLLTCLWSIYVHLYYLIYFLVRSNAFHVIFSFFVAFFLESCSVRFMHSELGSFDTF